MPVHRDPFQKGALVIQFEVAYPDKEWFSNPENVGALSALLPTKEEQGLSFIDSFIQLFILTCLVEVRDREEVMLQDFDTHLHSGRGRGGRNAYDQGDDDDEEGMGGGGVRCQQQ